jgi:serine/threonine protein kinase
MDSEKPEEADAERLDHFRVVKELGRGTSAVVKLGINQTDGKLYALKLLKDPSLFERFKAEYEIMNKLKHPRIMKVFCFIEKGAYTKKNGEKLEINYYVMKYLKHGELFNIVYKNKAFSENLSRHLFHQLIETIDFLHSNSISHRDLKPENLLVDDDYNLVLADFGFAKHHTEGIITKTRLGTIGYAAPEITLGEPYDSTKADIFSAGVTLFVLYSRNIPFKEARLTNRAFKTLFENPSFMFGYYQQNFQKLYSEPLRNLILNMLCFNPENRFTLSQIKTNEWYNQLVDHSSANLEIEAMLEIFPVIKPSNSLLNLVKIEEKSFRSCSSKDKLLIENELPNEFASFALERIDNLPEGCVFDFRLNCKSKKESLKILCMAIKDLGGNFSKGDQNEMITNLISKLNFEKIIIEVTLYEVGHEEYFLDIVRIDGSFFAYLSVKEDLIFKLREIASSYK